MWQSQKGQDKWVAEEVFRGKREGFFLDLAAAHPINGNNTYVLEKHYGWTGICIEANRNTFQLLEQERDCTCVNTCVDATFQSVEFACDGVSGGIVDADTDNNERLRPGRIQQLRTMSQVHALQSVPLQHILQKHGAPQVIDYFSLDVEGAETRVLKYFPFEKWTFLALTIERPTPLINRILLEDLGYVFVRNIYTPQVKEHTETFYIHRLIDRPDIKKDAFAQVPAKRAQK